MTHNHINVGVNIYDNILRMNINKLDTVNSIYTLSGGLDSSLIISCITGQY